MGEGCGIVIDGWNGPARSSVIDDHAIGCSDECLIRGFLQVFEGVHPVYDIFNHQNVEFWSTLMVAYNTTGFISCAGTNFAVRANALRAIGMLSTSARPMFCSAGIAPEHLCFIYSPMIEALC